MILASEALQLPTAQLSSDEKEAADKVEAEIDAHIRATMKRGGCEITVAETRSNVIVEVSQRLKTAGYQLQWTPVVEESRFNSKKQNLVGWKLNLAPTDEAFKAAARALLS